MGKITLEEIVEKVNHVPAFPATMTRLVKIMDDPNVDLTEIKDLIKTDEGLTTKLLRVSNSAFYRGRREIKTVEDAVIVLGLKTVKSMVFATAVGPILSKELKGYEMEKDALWRQSQISAITSQAIAKKIRYKEIDLAYTAGLLKGIGKVILDEYINENYTEITESVREREITFEEAEKEILGFNHAEVGARLAEKWNLPPEIVEVIRYHHNPTEAKLNKKLAMICHLADNLIMIMGINLGADGLAYEFCNEALPTLGLEESDLTEIMSDVAEVVNLDETYF